MKLQQGKKISSARNQPDPRIQHVASAIVLVSVLSYLGVSIPSEGHHESPFQSSSPLEGFLCSSAKTCNAYRLWGRTKSLIEDFHSNRGWHSG